MTNSRPFRFLRPRWILVAVPLLILLTASFLVWRAQAVAATSGEETLRFNHSKHVAAGVPCVFCHPGVLENAVAGIPSMAKCAGCHQNIQVTTAEGQASVDLLLRLWEEGRPLRWPKINDQPDFSHFAHFPHIAAGVSCEACHGNVGEMTMARPAYRINMGFCLACHRQQSPEKVTRLQSCATCHK